MGELSELEGIGAKSEQLLNGIGVRNRSDLEVIGPVAAYVKLKSLYGSRVSLNFLYAMVGALRGIHWSKIARKEKSQLLAELDGYLMLQERLEGKER